MQPQRHAVHLLLQTAVMLLLPSQSGGPVRACLQAAALCPDPLQVTGRRRQKLLDGVCKAANGKQCSVQLTQLVFCLVYLTVCKHFCGVVGLVEQQD